MPSVRTFAAAALVLAPALHAASLSSGGVVAQTDGARTTLTFARGSVSLQPVRFTGSAGSVGLPAVSSEVSDDVHHERTRGPLTETIAEVDGGMQVTWEISSRPGVGDSPALEVSMTSGAARPLGPFTDLATPAHLALGRIATLSATDATGAPIAASHAGGSASFVVRIGDSDTPWPVRVDLLVSSTAQSIPGPAAGSAFGRSVAAAGDVDGDGFDDLVVGARAFTGTLPSEGRALLYRGSAGGLVPEPAWSALGGAADARLGASVAGAGDVDGDGFDDVIVGAQGLCEARLYRGAASGLARDPAWSFRSPQAASDLGAAVASAGDVNGDGRWDVVVGEPRWDGAAGADCGRLLVFLGRADGLASAPDVTIEGTEAYAQLGLSVACAGDVNGDGFDDLLAGAPLADARGDDSGTAVLVLGGASGTLTRSSWRPGDTVLQVGALLGLSVASAGDVDGDGFDDVAIGAPRHDVGSIVDAGQIVVHRGSAAGLSPSPSLVLPGTLTNEQRGWSVGFAGDLTGDAAPELVLGTPPVGGNGGRVEIVALSAAWAPPAVDLLDVLVGDPGDELGIAVAGAGDLDGDGLAEVACGAWFADEGRGWAQGQVVVVRGSAGLPPSSPNCTRDLPPRDSTDTVGALTASGDVNGDGFDDVIAGLSSAANGTVRGMAWLLPGSARGPEAAPTWTSAPVPDVTRIGSAVAVGDVNGDGFDDVFALGLTLGRTRVVGWSGSLAGPGAWPSWLSPPGLDLRQQILVGDVTHDGFADVVLIELTATGAQLAAWFGRPDGPGPQPDWRSALPAGMVTSATGGLVLLPDSDGDGEPEIAFTGVLGGSKVIAVVPCDSQPRMESVRIVTLGTSSEPGLAAGGDVNGDGFSDLLAFRSTFVHVLLGGAGGLDFARRVDVGTGTSPVARGADVDGDGFSDVVIGLSRQSTSMGSDSGEIRVHRGSPSGPAGTACWAGIPTSVFARLGSAVATGDVDGNGTDDVLGMAISSAKLHGFLGSARRGGRLVARQLRVSGGRIALRGAVRDEPWNAQLPATGPCASPSGELRVRVTPSLPEDDALVVPRSGVVVAAEVAPRDGRIAWRARLSGRLGGTPWRTRWISPSGNAARESDLLRTQNRAPECAFPTVSAPAGSIIVQATIRDADGDAATASWQLGDCPNGILGPADASQAAVGFADGCSGECEVVLTVADSHGASSSCRLTVPWTRVRASAGSDVSLTCRNPTATLRGSGEGGAPSWSPSDGVSDPASFVTEALRPGTFILAVTDPNTGCVATDTVVVTDEIGTLRVSAGADRSLSCTDTSATLSAVVSGFTGIVTFSWAPASLCRTPSAPTTEVIAAGRYVVTVVDAGTGCRATDTVDVLDVAEMEPSALDVRPGVEPLRLRLGGLGLELTWEDTGAGSYSVYRGRIGALAAGSYDHAATAACHLPATATSLALPPADSYYLVGATCRDGRRSSLGSSSFGAERPPPTTDCP